MQVVVPEVDSTTERVVANARIAGDMMVALYNVLRDVERAMDPLANPELHHQVMDVKHDLGDFLWSLP